MITDYFKYKTGKPASIIQEYYEVHRCFIERNNFQKVYNEVKSSLIENSARQSCVCINSENIKDFTIYNLPLINWTKTIFDIRNKILTNQDNNSTIDYGLVHYYHNDKATINWHSDREALRSNIYSISIGGVRRFCLKDKITKEVLTFDLYDGDFLIMKVGCQDKYEHCIKSIKEFNQPRISITFRQIEKPICYYTFDYSNLSIVITNEEPPNTTNYRQITKTKQGIIVGIIQDSIGEKFNNYDIISNENASLLKSNLQKAIRRKEEEIALQSTMKMIVHGQTIDLLRRLTIISFEDVQLNKYYPIILWYYIALTNNYELLDNDVNFIYSYVKLLCKIDEYDEIDNSSIPEIYKLNELYNNIDCIALYMRIQYGGFSGEIRLMNNLISGILKKKYIICNNDIQIVNHSISNLNSIKILDCAIDFHCFPKMPEKVLAKISVNKDLTEEDIRKYIWHYDSSINVRINQVTNRKKENLDDTIWNTIIKPKCDNYRYYIKKMLNI
jgi:hypothetical protein